MLCFLNGILLFCVFLEKRYNPPAFQQDYRKKAGERILEIGKNLAANRAAMKELFADCGDIVFRDFAAAEGQGQLFLVYVDNMVNTTAVEDAIMTNIMNRCHDTETEERLLGLMESVIANRDVQQVDTIEKAAAGVLAGDTVIFMEGSSFALQASTRGYPNRGVGHTETEVVVQGPKDAFTELLAFNLVLIRRRIQDTRLKVVRTKAGSRTKTDVALMYFSDLVRPEILRQAKRQLERLRTDSILDCGSLEQLLEKRQFSPFPQLQMTERPDKAAAALLEGRVVLVVDNTPFVILLPVTLNLFFQAAEDYYDRWEIMSLIRFMRYVAAFVAVALPGLYLALTVYHPELLPTSLALKIATTRQSIPFSVAVEVISMELAFELLREAGVRLPSPVSATIGIVGGIIIGSAAVDAGLVSPAVVIISALTGICSFVIPNISVVSGLRLSKYLVIFLSATLGLYGFWAGILLLVVHLAGLSSYGIPYLYPFCSASVNHYRDLEDSLFRLPLPWLKRQSIFMKKRGER